MEEIGGRSAVRRLAGKARARLSAARLPLIVGGACLLWLAWLAGGAYWQAALALLLIAAAVAFSPRIRRGVRPVGAAPDPAPSALVELTGSDVVAALPDPAMVLDRNGSLVYANQAATAAFGPMPPGTLLPVRFRAPEMRQLIAGILGDRRPAAIDHVEKVPIERSFRVSAARIGPSSALFLLHFRDQSEIRRIDRMRADFIANASHELRTPLASIAGFIETLRGPARDDDKARDNFLQIMQAQTARMARLIDDLLSLSRIEMKPYVRSDERIDLAELVASVVEALRHLAAESGVEIGFVAPPQPLLVPGSRDELIQVFENLLENACKYGQSGGRVEVEFGVTDAGPRPEARVTIRDHGPGIAEEHIPRITERFYRIDVETSRAQKGTGLGLAIVKHILTRHDGRLVVKSTLGEGSAFTVHLPLD